MHVVTVNQPHLAPSEVVLCALHDGTEHFFVVVLDSELVILEFEILQF